MFTRFLIKTVKSKNLLQYIAIASNDVTTANHFKSTWRVYQYCYHSNESVTLHRYIVIMISLIIHMPEALRLYIHCINTDHAGDQYSHMLYSLNISYVPYRIIHMPVALRL